MTSRWELLVHHRAWCWKMGWFMFAIAILLAVLDPWVGLRLPAAGMFAIFAMWMHSTHQMLGQLADAQAREDMRRLARKEQVE